MWILINGMVQLTFHLINTDQVLSKYTWELKKTDKQLYLLYYIYIYIYIYIL